MTATVLTPPGIGAIAVIEIVDGWSVIQSHFVSFSNEGLPDTAILHRSWFGTWAGGDEVMIVVTAVEPSRVEIHSHGGLQVVSWLLSTVGQPDDRVNPIRLNLLEVAPTLKTAGIILDQLNGAFDRAIQNGQCDRLRSLIPAGRHVVEPFTVVIAGPPNVGKSSLVNAIVGYSRSIVSPIAGTTRDLVRSRIALNGWPVELIDSAGVREAVEYLEDIGISRLREKMTTADLVIWVVDAADPQSIPHDERIDLVVINKADLLPPHFHFDQSQLSVSAQSAFGIERLLSAVASRLVPTEPKPGEGVPIFLEHFATLDAEFVNTP